MHREEGVTVIEMPVRATPASTVADPRLGVSVNPLARSLKV